MLGTGVANAAGNWTLTSLALANGAHTLTTKQTDVCGKHQFRFSITGGHHRRRARRHVNPAGPVAASDSGASNTDNITSVTTPKKTGMAEAGSTVTLFDGTTKIVPPSPPGAPGTSPSSSLSNGAHAISATATDVAGNVKSRHRRAVGHRGYEHAVRAGLQCREHRPGRRHRPPGRNGDRSRRRADARRDEGRPARQLEWAFLTAPGNTVHVNTAFETDAAGNVASVTVGNCVLGASGANTLTSTAGMKDLRWGRGGHVLVRSPALARP